MNRRVEADLDRFRRSSELANRIALTPEEQELRQSLRRGLLKNAGIDEAAVARLRAARRERMRDLVPAIDVRHAPYAVPTLFDMQGPPGSLAMWWAQTSWSWNAPGLSVSWQDDGPHFSGVVHVDSDPLQKYFFHILAQFELTADRIPASARGRVLSAPVANVFGYIYGIAKDIGMFNFDDQWVKCWLNTAQSVWVTIPGVSIPWGFKADTRQLVFLEDIGWESTYLPGRISLPALEFDLIPAVTNAEIDLSFNFDMQLEGGDSNLVFGHGYRDWPSNIRYRRSSGAPAQLAAPCAHRRSPPTWR